MTHEPELVYYDGHCGLCHATVRFVVKHDPDGRRFRFAPLGGGTYRQTISPEVRASLPSSVLVCTRDGRLLTRSSAIIHILRQLESPWPLIGSILHVIPRPLRDLGYRCVACVRRKLFKRPETVCPMVPLAQRRRFLP